jgi:hypothetical protein
VLGGRLVKCFSNKENCKNKQNCCIQTVHYPTMENYIGQVKVDTGSTIYSRCVNTNWNSFTSAEDTVCGRDISIGTSNRLRVGRPRNRASITGKGRSYILPTASTPALEPILPPVQWYQKVHYSKKSGRVVKLTTHIHLVLRLRICEAIPHFSVRLHCVMLNYARGQFYVCFYKADEQIRPVPLCLFVKVIIRACAGLKSIV